MAPQPADTKEGEDLLMPVKPFPHFPTKVPEDEFECLNLNIAAPPDTIPGPHPVMIWIHGGSLLFGSSSFPIVDLVKLVSHSIERKTPIACVSINYRVGFFGFLASRAIEADLAKDGYAGAGNFGLTEQQNAIKWVQRYISSFDGDPDNVTIFGESVGGMSVAHQVYARQPAPFHRAISMSGHLNCIPVWTIEEHEKRYNALLSYTSAAGDNPAIVESRIA